MKKEPCWFRGYKAFIRLFSKKTTFVHLGEIPEGSILLSNHVGTSAPLSFALYHPHPARMWGTHEMNSGLRNMYRYQTRVFYHEKRGWNLTLARIYCLLASPLTNLFYKGLNLISTHHDTRFRTTLRESLDTLHENGNVIIFPENSKNGYLDVLEGFHGGCVMLMHYCLERGLDVPVCCTYFNKYNNIHVIDKPIMASELFKNGDKWDVIAQKLCDRTNDLGRLSADPKLLEEAIKEETKEAVNE